MKKLNRFRGIGFICIGIAVILEVLGALTKTTALSVAAFVILICLIVAYLILYRCPYCGAFLAAYLEHAPLNVCGQIASAVASFGVEKHGCQTNIPTREQVVERIAE